MDSPTPTESDSQAVRFAPKFLFSPLFLLSTASLLMSLLAIGMGWQLTRSTKTSSEIYDAILTETKPLNDALDQMNKRFDSLKVKTADSDKRPVIDLPSVRLIREPVAVEADELDLELDLVTSQLRTMYPQSVEAIHVQALMKAQTRRHDEAKQLWQQCIQLAPTKPSYYINIASTAFEQGEYEEAEAILRQAIAKDITTPDIQYHLAITLPKLAKHEEAMEFAKEALKDNPRSADFWSILGKAQLELGMASESEQSFRKALAFGTESSSVLLGLGTSLVRQGKSKEGTEFLTRFQQSKQDDLTGQKRWEVLTDRELRRTATIVFTEAALLHFQNKSPLHAEYLLARCVAIDPKSQIALRALADFYFRNQQPREERLVRERVLEVGKGEFSDYLNLSKVCAVLLDMPSAEAYMKQAATAYPLSIEPFAALAQINAQSGKIDRARWFAEQSIDREPTVEGFLFLADLCKQAKDPAAEATARKLAMELEGKTKLNSSSKP